MEIKDHSGVIFPPNTPSIRVYFNTCNETTCQNPYHVEYLDYNLECDICSFMGSYYLDGEKYKIGLCHICLINSKSVDKIEIGDYID